MGWGSGAQGALQSKKVQEARGAERAAEAHGERRIPPFGSLGMQRQDAVAAILGARQTRPGLTE